MNDIPQLSIIIPVYNNGQYISECLDCLLEINGVSYEVICIDDGSTDNSHTILLSYMHKFDNLRIISIKNSGAYYTRNLGLKLARGKYIEFVDSDDYINSSMLNSIIKHMDDNELDMMTVSGKQVKNGVASKFSDFEYDFIPNNLKDRALETYEIKEYFYCIPGYMHLTFYNNKFLKKINNKFPIEKYYADFYFLQSALVQSKRYAICQWYFYNYRQHANQITKNNNLRYFTYLKVQRMVFDIYLKYCGRAYALKYLNYFTQFFNRHITYVESRYRDEYVMALYSFYDYCLNKRRS